MAGSLCWSAHRKLRFKRAFLFRGRFSATVQLSEADVELQSDKVNAVNDRRENNVGLQTWRAATRQCEDKAIL